MRIIVLLAVLSFLLFPSISQAHGYCVYIAGQFVGCDPSAAVRSQLIRDWYARNGS